MSTKVPTHPGVPAEGQTAAAHGALEGAHGHHPEHTNRLLHIFHLELAALREVLDRMAGAISAEATPRFDVTVPATGIEVHQLDGPSFAALAVENPGVEAIWVSVGSGRVTAAAAGASPIDTFMVGAGQVAVEPVGGNRVYLAQTPGGADIRAVIYRLAGSAPPNRVALGSAPVSSSGIPIVQEVIGATVSASEVLVGLAGTLLVAAGTGRLSLTFQNLGPNPVWVGPVGVTVGSGFQLDPAPIAGGVGGTYVAEQSANAAWSAITQTAGQLAGAGTRVLVQSL